MTELKTKKNAYIKKRWKTDKSFREYHKEYSEKYYKDERKTLLAKQKENNEKNKKKIAAYQKAYYEKNKKKLKKKQSEYYEEHKRKYQKYMKKYYQENKDQNG